MTREGKAILTSEGAKQGGKRERPEWKGGSQWRLLDGGSGASLSSSSTLRYLIKNHRHPSNEQCGEKTQEKREIKKVGEATKRRISSATSGRR